MNELTRLLRLLRLAIEDEKRPTTAPEEQVPATPSKPATQLAA